MREDQTTLAALDDVTHRYGSTEALSHVTVKLGSGQVTALLGPNGAGKTTMVRLLTGLARPTQGTAMLFGNPQDVCARRRMGASDNHRLNRRSTCARWSRAKKP
jgi:ABC-2 type transport system ATP-binding protein